jgi:hypothetical protein
MGRIPDLENSRFLPPPDSPYPTGLDDDIASRGTTRPTEIDDPLKTHILLAACQRVELAYEACQSTGRYGGDFTSLLLDLLQERNRNLKETTYIGLFHTLGQREYKSRLPKQTPYVEGDNKTRTLFKTTGPVPYFPVLLENDGSFSVAAGTIHGINPDTEFTITSGNDNFPGLKPHTVSGVRSSFHKSELGGKILRDDSRAEVPQLNQSLIKVLLKEAPDDPSNSEGNDVVISLSPDGFWKVERRDRVIPLYAKSVVQVKGTPQGTRRTGHAIADAITHFTFHLLQSKPTSIGDDLGFKLERLVASHPSPLKTTYSPAANGEISFDRKPPPAVNDGVSASADKISASAVVSGYAKIPDLKSYFSFTLSIKNCKASLFPYVFGFDPSTYEISVCGFHFWHKVTECSLVFRISTIPSLRRKGR